MKTINFIDAINNEQLNQQIIQKESEENDDCHNYDNDTKFINKHQ